MGLLYTKKKDDDKDETTVQADEFINRLISGKRDPEKTKELPKTEIQK